MFLSLKKSQSEPTPQVENSQEVETRLAHLKHNRMMSELFEQFATLPICVELEEMSGCQRGLVNALNGMTLIEDQDSSGRKVLEIRTVPNTISGSWTTNCFTSLSVKESEKMLAIWILMSQPFAGLADVLIEAQDDVIIDQTA